MKNQRNIIAPKNPENISKRNVIINHVHIRFISSALVPHVSSSSASALSSSTAAGFFGSGYAGLGYSDMNFTGLNLIAYNTLKGPNVNFERNTHKNGQKNKMRKKV